MTTDDKRNLNETFVFSDDEELWNEEKFDEFSEFFKKNTTVLFIFSLKFLWQLTYVQAKELLIF